MLVTRGSVRHREKFSNEKSSVNQESRANSELKLGSKEKDIVCLHLTIIF